MAIKSRFYDIIKRLYVHSEDIDTTRLASIIIERYTGFNDKNGIEICDGDIVSYNCVKCYVAPCQRFGKHIGESIFYRCSDDGEHASICYDKFCDTRKIAEIIGNLHDIHLTF